MRKIRPYITEKSVDLTKQGKFTLEVDFDATKTEIEHLVKKYYKVMPLTVNSLRTKYLQATKQRKSFTDRGMKKVIIKLSKDQKIPGFEFEAPEETKKKTEKKVKNVKES